MCEEEPSESGPAWSGTEMSFATRVQPNKLDHMGLSLPKASALLAQMVSAALGSPSTTPSFLA